MMDALLRPAAAADAPAIAKVRVDAWRITYKGLIPETYLAAMKIEDSTALWTRVLSAPPNQTNTFVALVNGAVVGFASGLMLAEPKHGFDAELSAVYLQREAQRAGIGRRLVGRIAAAQRAQGATGLIVWVIAGNKGARAFYESLGAELIVEQPFNWDGMDLIEAGYGWCDLAPLISVDDIPAMLH
jgi:GNAT superfamily N-acetyltransferase